MWENETVVLVATLKKRLMGGGERFQFKRIIGDEAVPTFIKQLFEDRIRKYITTETPLQIRKTPHFDLTTESTQHLKSEFKEVLIGAAAFPANEVEEVLREALILRLDYLLKPIDTMRRLLFDGRTSVTIAEAEDLLHMFKKILPYFEQLVERCMASGESDIVQDTYGEISTDMLHDMMKEDSVQPIMRDYSILTDFLSETRGEEVSRLEGTLLQNFLADRNAWGFRRAIDVEMKLGREDFSAADLELTLKRYLELRNEFTENEDRTTDVKDQTTNRKAAKKQESEKNTEAEDWHLEESVSEDELFIEDELKKVEDLKKSEASLEEIEAVPSKDADVAKIEEQLEETVGVPADEQDKEPPVEKIKPMKIIRKEKKEKETKEETAVFAEESQIVKEPKPVRTGGFKDLIDDKTEKTFVKKLFGGDKESYDELLGRLEEAESWRVAKILIDNELFKRDVDPFSREAIKLVDMVYSLYYPEERVGGK